MALYLNNLSNKQITFRPTLYGETYYASVYFRSYDTNQNPVSNILCIPENEYAAVRLKNSAQYGASKKNLMFFDETKEFKMYRYPEGEPENYEVLLMSPRSIIDNSVAWKNQYFALQRAYETAHQQSSYTNEMIGQAIILPENHNEPTRMRTSSRVHHEVHQRSDERSVTCPRVNDTLMDSRDQADYVKSEVIKYNSTQEKELDIHYDFLHSQMQFQAAMENYGRCINIAAEYDADMDMQLYDYFTQLMESGTEFSTKDYKSNTKDLRDKLRSEINRLEESGEVPDNVMPKGTRVGKSAQAFTREMELFNELRGLSVKDSDGSSITRNYNGTFYVSSISGYAFSEEEMRLLESGDYIIAADVPDKQHAEYVNLRCKLEKDETESGFEYYHVVGTPIDILSDEFMDTVHNERYRLCQDEYDGRILALESGAINKAKAASDALLSGTKDTSAKRKGKSGAERAQHEPTRKLLAIRVQGNKLVQAHNSYDRLKSAYASLRQQPPTKTGEKLGFETAYDEHRFADGVRFATCRIKTIKSQLDFAEAHGVTSSSEALYKEFGLYNDILDRLDNESKLRQTPPSDDGKAKGLVSAWEEKVLSDYEELVNTKYEKTPENRAIMWRKYRLDEALAIRGEGFDPHIQKMRQYDNFSTYGVPLEDGKTGMIPDFV